MKNLFPYTYDFLSFVFDSLEARKYIKAVILFGSVATGEHDKESDIDLFIDVASEELVEPVERLLKEAEKEFYHVVEKKWRLMGIETPIKSIVGSLETYRWKELKSEIISTGITLYGKYQGIKKGLKHFTIFSYGLSGLNQNKRVSFIRKCFGYSQKQNKKEYLHSGYLKEIGGARLGKNSILVPIDKTKDFHRFLLSFKITPEIREVWVKG